MGLLSFFANRTSRTTPRKALTLSPGVLEAVQDRQADFGGLIGVGQRPYGVNPVINAAFIEVQSAGYGWIYKHTPAVRTVIDYLARNIAQLTLCLYERKADHDREQDYDHPAAEVMRHPNPTTPGARLIRYTLTQWLINHNAYLLKLKDGNGNITLYPLTPSRVGVIGRNHFYAEAYRIYRDDASFFDVSPSAIIHWPGDDPEDARKGFSPLETLRKDIAEDAASQEANLALLKSGLTQPGYIKRPIEAPDWGQEGADRFTEKWREATKNPDRTTPVAEEGMEWQPMGVSPKDAEMLDGRRFTIEEVCRLYGMPGGPLGVGTMSQADLEEQHKEVYEDVLPPIAESLCDYLDLGLLQQEYDEPDYYFEFDMDEKLSGDDRIKTLVTAAGAPIMLRDEARSRLGLAKVPDGDELVTPLNVIVGGKPSPNTMPTQDPNAPPQDGSHRPDAPIPAGGAATASLSARAADYERVLQDHFAHQAKAALQRGDRRFDTGGQNKRLAASLSTVEPARDFGAVAEEINKATQTEPDFTTARAQSLATALADHSPHRLAADIPQEARWLLAGFSEEDVDRMRAMQLSEGLLSENGAEQP